MVVHDGVSGQHTVQHSSYNSYSYSCSCSCSYSYSYSYSSHTCLPHSTSYYIRIDLTHLTSRQLFESHPGRSNTWLRCGRRNVITYLWTGAASRLLHRQNVPRHLRPHTASDGGLPWPCCAVSITLLQARCCTSSTTLLSLLSAPSDLGEEERCFEPKLNGGRIRAAAVALLGGVLRVHI